MKTRISGRARPRPGGRSARVVSAVLRSTLEVLGRAGYAGLRIDDVAAAAGVNKTTIYRRWPTRAGLVADAISRFAVRPAVVPTGRLERDLAAVLMASTSRWGTRAGRGISRVLVAERSDQDVERIARMIRERNRAVVLDVLERARTRGDLPSSANPRLMADILLGTTYSRLRESSRPLDSTWVRALVRFVLASARAR